MNVTERPYRMTKRAQKAAATGERILDATVELFWEHPTVDLSLDAVAGRADVTVQTVIRRFRNKKGLIAAAIEREVTRVSQTRDAAAVTDAASAIRQLVDHYEEMGDRAIRLLAEEVRMPALQQMTELGRAFHRAWCEQVFGAAIGRRRGGERERLLAQLVAICDVYTWKLLRRDAGLTRPDTELSLLEMLQPLLEES